MKVPALLVLVSLIGICVALLFPGLGDLLLLAGPMALASLWLWVQAWRRQPQVSPRWVVIDGSNVMHWRDAQPDLAPLREVIAELSARGYTPGAVFDANAGYKLVGRHQDDRSLAGALGLPRDRVLVAPKGTPADPLLLESARDLGALIVTQDRFRDWAADYPEVTDTARFIRGGYREGKLWLDVGGA